MKDARKTHHEDEPIGIVISRGSSAVEPPRFWAYVWCQVPETPTAVEVKAA